LEENVEVFTRCARYCIDTRLTVGIGGLLGIMSDSYIARYIYSEAD
jgi:hypothetical protein